jgi:hypothetical protein
MPPSRLLPRLPPVECAPAVPRPRYADSCRLRCHIHHCRWGYWARSTAGKRGSVSSRDVSKLLNDIEAQVEPRYKIKTNPRSYTPNQAQRKPGCEIMVGPRLGDIQMVQVRKGRGAPHAAGHFEIARPGAHAASWTAGPRVLPELSEFLGQFLPRGAPIRLDIIADVIHVAFEIEFVLLEPRDIKFLSSRPTRELPGNILLVVTDNSGTLVQI